MKKNTKLLILDGFILLVIAAVIAGGFMGALSPLKKGKEADPLVTAINQENLERTQKVLGEETYQKLKAKKKPATYQDYVKERTAKTDECGRTPLMWLSYVNYSETKAVPAVDGKEPTLGRREKADAKRLPIIDVLISAGTDVNAKDNDGWTALMWAAWSGLPKVTERLVALKTDITVVDRQGNSALTLAAMRGNLEVVKILMAKGAITTPADKVVIQKAMKEYPKKKAAYEQILGLLNGSIPAVPAVPAVPAT